MRAYIILTMNFVSGPIFKVYQKLYKAVEAVYGGNEQKIIAHFLTSAQVKRPVNLGCSVE